MSDQLPYKVSPQPPYNAAIGPQPPLNAAIGPQPTYKTAAYNSGRLYNLSAPPGMAGSQAVGNGPSFGGHQQNPSPRGPVMPQSSSGSYPRSFVSTPGAAPPHSTQGAPAPPTDQFRSMTLNDRDAANIQPVGLLPSVSGPQRSGMPPPPGHISGPNPPWATGPPPSVGSTTSANHLVPSQNVSSGPGRESPNIGYSTDNLAGYPTNVSKGFSTQLGGMLSPASGDFYSSSGAPKQSPFHAPVTDVGHHQDSYSTSEGHCKDELLHPVPSFSSQPSYQFPSISPYGAPGQPVHPRQPVYPSPTSTYGAPGQPVHPRQPVYPSPTSTYGALVHPTPTSTYGAPVHPPPTPTSQCGAPMHPPPTPTSQYGAPVHPPPTPTSQYGAPMHPPPTPTSQYGAPVHPPPTSQYGAPVHPPPTTTSTYGAPVHPTPTSSYSALPYQALPPHQPPPMPPPVYQHPPIQAPSQPSQQPYQHSQVHPPYQPAPTLQQPYQPAPTLQQPYQPAPTLQQPYQPSPTVQQLYQPVQSEYQPPPVEPPYQPPPSMPSPQPVQKRLNPDQIPSPVQVIEDDKRNRSGTYQTNLRGNVPPLVTTDFITQDQGNANPIFLRSTIYNIPTTADMLKSSHLPFALVVTPFAEHHDQEQPTPLVDLGLLGPIRCKRCKAYMCSFMQFIDGGQKFQCPFCNAITDVPDEYFAHLDHTGRRVDWFSRPELCLGSYEFVATTSYCKNGVPPKEPAFIFLIDVSYNSVRSGLVQLICEKLKSEILVNLPREAGVEESEIRVGFVTYHKELHFYNVKNSLSQPQMMVVSDLEDVFVPLVDGFLVKLSESGPLIDSLLAQIPALFTESKETSLILGPVIQAGLDALRSADRSGRLYIFHTGLPTAEAPGKLKNRDDRKLLGTDREKSILTPQTLFYSKLGAECVAAGCSVDLFLFPNQYIDIATISDISKVTGGNIFKYSYFQANIDRERFLADLKSSLKRVQAFDATLRVRTSTGIRPVNFYGNFFMSNTTDVEMASVDSDSSVCVEVKYDDKLSETEGAYIQVAVLYTSLTGQRRLRCHNLSLNTCTSMTDLFRNCELDTLINVFSKQALHMSMSSNPKHVRDHFTNQVARILTCYRQNCTSQSSPGQLILPECMKLLPVYANCLIKNDSISGGSEISTDDRSYLMHLINRMDMKSSQVFFYPRLLPVHNLDLESTDLPVAVRCSIERLEDSGIYILENGLFMFLWIGQNASHDLVLQIFGVASAAQIDIDKTHLLQLDNPVSRRICGIIAKIRKERSKYLKLTIVRQRDKLQPWFEHFLVEDKGPNSGSSYVDFLLHIHKEIRNLLS